MLPNQNKQQNQMCFQIHKNGAPVDGVSYAPSWRPQQHWKKPVKGAK
jgi:hypothetical protein